MNYREVGTLKKMINGWQRHEQQELLCRKIWKQSKPPKRKERHPPAHLQNSRVEAEDHNDGEEEDDEEPFVHRRVVAKPPPVAKATIISVDPDTIVGREPLGPATYEVLVNVAIKRDAMVPYEYEGLRCCHRSIAWPSSKMKPYKPGASSSSRR